ncbi:VOC family protein [Halobacillus shinanisalinarum]|uniref:VOC family protein n=1 Tax=Halobacillus shinanisalinarum TaxID=2932258 RepID=A0ABY4GZ72_9BACI|nr:VOC family protein [Halobacillus shinanisalinarum]UOQ93492.1 VOC family protein [Halobacillus shinanisalinarum]
MNKLYPFIVVENCNEAVEYYHDIFGGEIKVLNKQEGKLLHAELHVNGSTLHFSDSYGIPVTNGENVKVMMQFDSEEEITKVFNSLKKDGKVAVDLEDTFFGALHGQIIDRNQVNWVLNFFRKNEKLRG